ncbi:hypothetical protein D3C72_1950070 [compost metagenome]
MDARRRHHDVAGLQGLHGLASQHFPGRQAADERNRNRTDMRPHDVLPARAPDRPRQRHADQNGGRRAAVPAAVQRRDAVENQEIAAKNDQIADAGAERAGQIAAVQCRRAADRQRRESRSQSS